MDILGNTSEHIARNICVLLVRSFMSTDLSVYSYSIWKYHVT